MVAGAFGGIGLGRAVVGRSYLIILLTDNNVAIVADTTSNTWTGYTRQGDRAKFFLTRPFDRAAANGGNGAMLAFLGIDREAIDRFHTAALENGGTCEGPPGVREGMNPVFYAAYVRDCDGNKLCAFVRK